MARLAKVEGIGEAYADKLQEAGIGTTQALLAKGSSPQGRREIAETTDISATLLLRWINHIDLFRIKGVGAEYAELLEAAGVDTVPELAQRVPANLYDKMAEVNRDRQLVRKLPAPTQVDTWIEQAQQLPRTITY